MNDLANRSDRMLRTEEPFKLTGKLRSVHFLRGVFSRASMCLPAFYYFLGSASEYERVKAGTDYPLKVAQSYSEFSDLNTLSLACRKIFDHSTKPDLTGANFSKVTDSVLNDHAAYWADVSGKPQGQCLKALKFLRKVFAKYSKTDNSLLKSNDFLSKRIGLLKQYADRAAAHLSLQNYELDIKDIAHVTAAVALLGEIIRSFDNVSASGNYFTELDVASHSAAKRIFPQIVDFQLLGNFKISQHAVFCWSNYDNFSIEELFDEIQLSIGVI